MSSFQLRRVLGVVTAAALALMLVGAGVASASPPHWVMTVTKVPPTVAAGANAGYIVTITNNGPSNIATLFLTSDVSADPSYVGTPTHGSCNSSGPLYCAFGTLTPQAGQNSVTVTVAYTVGTSNFGVTFKGSTTGNTGSDGGASHGDFLYANPRITTTAVSNSQNFGGGFVVGDTSVQDFQTVGKKNLQATSLTSPSTIIPATVEDGITTGIACNDAHCANAFGEWSRINVNNGQVFGAPFKVTLLVYGGAVPNGTLTSDIVVLHTLDDGVTTEVISTDCSPSTGVPTNAECRTVTKVGNNYQIVIWLFKNGGLKGSI